MQDAIAMTTICAQMAAWSILQSGETIAPIVEDRFKALRDTGSKELKEKATHPMQKPQNKNAT